MSDVSQEIIARIPLEGDELDERYVFTEGNAAVLKIAPTDSAYGSWFDDTPIPDCIPSVSTLEQAITEATGQAATFDSTFVWEETGEIELAFTLAAVEPEPDRSEINELRGMLRAAEEDCRETELAWTLAKETANLKKKEHELSLERLRRLAREISEPLPLFEHAKKQAEIQEQDPDAWRDVPLSEALQGISEATILKLAESDLSTIGDLADYTNGGSVLIDLPGIGEATAEKILNAQADYWARTTAG